MKIKIFKTLVESNKATVFYFMFKKYGVWHTFTTHNYTNSIKEHHYLCTDIFLLSFKPYYFNSQEELEQFLKRRSKKKKLNTDILVKELKI